MKLTVNAIESRADLSCFQIQWERLISEGKRREPFLSHTWINSWLTYLSEDCKPYILIASQNETCIAILPLVLRRETWHRIPIHTLTFPVGMTSGNLRADLLASPGQEIFAAQAFVAYLHAHQDRWTCWDVGGLTADSVGFRALRYAIDETGWRCDTWHADTDLFFVRAQGSWQDYLNNRGRHFKRKLTDTRNRWKNTPGGSMRSLCTPEEIEQGIEWMLALDAHCTKAAREGVVRLTGSVADFYCEVIRDFAKKHTARIDFLFHAQTPIACLVSLAVDSVPFLFYIAYAPQFSSCSPGRILFEHAISETWKLDSHEVDFNGRTPFVKRWTDTAHSRVSGKVYSPSVGGRLAWLRDGIIEPIKRQSRLGRDLCAVTPVPDAHPIAGHSAAILPTMLQGDKITYYASGSAALLAGLKALPLQVGDEIVFPSYHCGSELAVILATGFKPRFYQVGRDLQVNAAAIRSALTEQTRAVYLIHYLGWPQQMAPISDLCQEHKLLLIEDSAQALYSQDCSTEVQRGNKPQLNFDVAMTIYSLHKFLPVIDGGALRWNLLSPSPHPKPILLGNRLVRRIDIIGARARARTGWRAWIVLFAQVCKAVVIRLPIRRSANPVAMHPSSLATVTALLHDEIIARRKTNHIRLHRLFNQYQMTTPLFPEAAPGFVPLVFAVIADNAEPLIKGLNEAGIEAGLHWPAADARIPFGKFDEVVFLKAHLVVMPVHQNMREEDFLGIQQVLDSMGLPHNNK